MRLDGFGKMACLPHSRGHQTRARPAFAIPAFKNHSPLTLAAFFG